MPEANIEDLFTITQSAVISAESRDSIGPVAADKLQWMIGEAVTARVIEAEVNQKILTTFHYSGPMGALGAGEQMILDARNFSDTVASGVIEGIYPELNMMAVHGQRGSYPRMNFGLYLIPILNSVREENVDIKIRRKNWRDASGPISRVLHSRARPNADNSRYKELARTFTDFKI